MIFGQDHVWSWMMNPANFQKIQTVFTNPTNLHESLQIFSTKVQNKSLKIRTHSSQIHTNTDLRTHESGLQMYVCPIPKDSSCGFYWKEKNQKCSIRRVSSTNKKLHQNGELLLNPGS
jgi:hypothetical protein